MLGLAAETSVFEVCVFVWDLISLISLPGNTRKVPLARVRGHLPLKSLSWFLSNRVRRLLDRRVGKSFAQFLSNAVVTLCGGIPVAAGPARRKSELGQTVRRLDS